MEELLFLFSTESIIFVKFLVIFFLKPFYVIKRQNSTVELHCLFLKILFYYLMWVNIVYKILLQHLQEMSIFGKSELEKTIEHLTCVNHQVIYQTGFGVYFVVWMTFNYILMYCMFSKLQNNILEKLCIGDWLGVCTLKIDCMGSYQYISVICFL